MDGREIGTDIGKKIRGYIVFAFIWVMLLAAIILLPLMTGLTAIFVRIFGQIPAAIYVGIVGNMMGPMLGIMGIMIGIAALKLIRYAKRSNLPVNTAKLKRPTLREAAVLLILIAGAVLLPLKLTVNIYNYVIDIPNAINQTYLAVEGTVTISEDTADYGPVVTVGKEKFTAGFADPANVVDGEVYRVEYLPHCRYIVSFTPVR